MLLLNSVLMFGVIRICTDKDQYEHECNMVAVTSFMNRLLL